MQRLALTIVTALALAAPAVAQAAYDPTGQYTWFGTRESMIAPGAGDEPKLDENGVPMITQGPNNSYVYNPGFVCAYGLQEWSFAMLGTGDADEHIANTLKIAEWAVTAQTPEGFWKYEFPWDVGGMGIRLPSGWGGALAQARCIGVLGRAYAHTRDTRYADSAERGLEPLKVDVSAGGLSSAVWDNPKYQYYEGYPTTPASYVLNIHQATTINLYEWWKTGSSPAARRLYENGLSTLRYVLRFYDLLDKTAYHLGDVTAARPVTINDGYHRSHVALLESQLQASPAETTLSGYHDRWATYKPCRDAGTTCPLVMGTPARSSPAIPERSLRGKSDYARAVLGDSGLAAYWRLGEPSWSWALDWAGNSDATYATPVGRAVPGAIAGDADGAASFEPAGSKVTLASGPGLLPNFTLEGWQRITGSSAPATNHTLFQRTGALRLLGRSGGYYAGITLSGTEYAVQGNTPSNIGSWVHWAFVRSGAAFSVYRNGVRVNGRWLPNSNAITLIGGEIGRTEGDLDEVAIYRRPLTAAEVATHHSLGRG